MKNLYKYELDFDLSWNYIKEIDEVNTLSSMLIKLIDFKQGRFFTLLPDKSNIKRLYEFEAGVILPQNPTVKYKDGLSSYSLIPKIDDELSEMILKKVSGSDFFCVFDDFNRSPKTELLFDLNERVYEGEIYYVLDKNTISHESFIECIDWSNTFWHSLCVVTKQALKNTDNKLTLEEIENICKKAELVFVTAYDSESYVFWEKDNFFDLESEKSNLELQVRAKELVTTRNDMDIKKYTGYFHDGTFLGNRIDGEKLEIWMTSSEIDPNWGVDPSILSSSNYIVGKLTLFGVKDIAIDEATAQQMRKVWEDTEILDLEMNDEVPNEVVVELNMQWENYSSTPKENLFVSIVIRAERYEWENLPDYPVPETDYYKYLDKDGNPVKRGSLASRLYPPEGVEL